MRPCNNMKILICTLCFFGATSCSDDGDMAEESNPLQPQGGASASAGAAGVGASSSGGSGGAPNAGSGGAAGTAAMSGSGGSAGAAGSGPSSAGTDAGADEEPSEEPPVVGFSDVFAILQDNCGSCHGTPGSFIPGFAQDDEEAAYEVTQEISNSGDDLYYERIIARAVVERTMPPTCGGALGTDGCLSEEDAELLERWVEGGALP